MTEMTKSAAKVISIELPELLALLNINPPAIKEINVAILKTLVVRA
jgi:hypothetical protein